MTILSEHKPREIAARVLQRRQEGGFVEHLLDQALATARLSPQDRHLCQELVYGTVRWQATLDWLAARKTSGRQQKPFLQNLLRLGLYQIFWLDRVPAQLRVPRTRKQAVAETAATDRVGDCTAFRDVRVDGFGGAAVDEPSGVRSHWRAQISNVADALSLRVIGAIVKRYDLERIACW